MNSEDQVFYITITSMAIAFFLAVMRGCYKSKCDRVEVGCIKIHRDTETESKYDEDHPIGESSPKNNQV